MDSRKRRDGAAIEELGWYNPIDKINSFNLNEDRIVHWLQEGAQTTDAAHKLLRRAGLAHKWHLIKQGFDQNAIDKEMIKWNLNKEDVEKKRLRRKKKEEPKEAAKEEPKEVAKKEPKEKVKAKESK